MPDLWGGHLKGCEFGAEPAEGDKRRDPFSTLNFFLFFLKPSSLRLGGHTKGGIDVGEEGSFVLCPAELAEETRLSQDSIQNANGGPSCT